MTTIITGINLHAVVVISATAKAAKDSSVTWLELCFAAHDQSFEVNIFMPLSRAQRLADAINDAWAEATFLTPSIHADDDRTRSETHGPFPDEAA